MTCVQNDILRVSARTNIFGAGDYVNVFHVKVYSPTVADADVLEDLALWCDNMWTFINSHIPTGCTYEDVNVFNETQDRPLGAVPWPVLVNGGGSGDYLVSQCAAFVRAFTGFSRNWARKFIGPFRETDNTDGGRVSTSLVADLLLWAAEWILPSALVTGVYTPVVYHSKTHTWKELLTAAVTDIWATCRRRRIGRGS